ncbi:MAG: HisA/HisF-related TIM barrel protein [Desulfurococcales archaeon]|jgi:phosphoribosylformimino-5-aminoimidazole carboxamide ribotide isomerase|nr:HisA/HisF-related TIM barrel protein [Desulfurococcales archaeon]
MMLEVHVAIDIYRRMVVRMIRGDPRNMIIYSRDPFEKGVEILNADIKRIHIVDLEAAINRKSIGPYTLEIARRLKEIGGYITVAGGIKSIEDLNAALEAGVDRVVIGTSIYRGEIGVEDALALGGNRIVLACDIRDRYVTHSGWIAGTGLRVEEALEKYSRAGFKLFLVTVVERDGTMSGVDLEVISIIPRVYRPHIIYSGGVSSKKDLDVLRRMGFRGSIVGRSYYEGLLSPGDIAYMEDR